MRIACAWLALMLPLALALACDATTGAGSSEAALVGDRWRPAPEWTAAGATVMERRGVWTLVRGEAEEPPPGTDVRPAVPMAVLREDGAALVPPAPVVDAALLDRSVAWVGLEGELWIDDGGQPRPIDDDVLGELAVSDDGRRVAYAKRAGRDGGVWLTTSDAAPARRLTPGLAVADRPLFVDDAWLVVVGSRPGGIAGVWLVRADASEQPRPVTNHGLRAGAPLGPGFVPPPAYHDSMRREGDELVYDDGRAQRRVALTEVLR